MTLIIVYLYVGDGKEGQDDSGESKTTQPKLIGSKKIFYMVGDVTAPSGAYLDENMVLHLISVIIIYHLRHILDYLSHC